MRKGFSSWGLKDKILFRIFPIFTIAVSLVSIILPIVFRRRDYFMANTLSDVLAISLLLISVTLIFSIKAISTQSEKENNVLDLDKIDSFSDREIVIICKILQNEKYDYIARLLNLSEITVKKSVATIYKKLGCTDKIDLFGKYANHSVVKGSAVFLTSDKKETPLLKILIPARIDTTQQSVR